MASKENNWKRSRKCQCVFPVSSDRLYDRVEQAVGAANLADAKAHLNELVSKAASGEVDQALDIVVHDLKAHIREGYTVVVK